MTTFAAQATSTVERQGMLIQLDSALDDGSSSDQLLQKPIMTTTSSAASFIQRVLEPAEEQWLRAGGHTLVRNSSAPLPPVVQASRDAFALLQTAAAIDRESAQLRHDLCELNGGEDEGSRRVRPCVAPPSATG